MSLALQIRISRAPAAPQGYLGADGFAGMLLEGVWERVEAARAHHEAGNTGEKQVILDSALMLLNELRTDLDLFNGGAVAANLADLYEYMGRRLRAAHLQNGIAAGPLALRALDEVSYLLEALHSAWVFLPAEARSASRN
jgi:flagellar secretion chaperone FliS